MEEHDLTHQVEVQSWAVPLAVMSLTSEIGYLSPDQNDDVKDEESSNQVGAAEAFLKLAKSHRTEDGSHNMEDEQTPEYCSDTATVQWVLLEHISGQPCK